MNKIYKPNYEIKFNKIFNIYIFFIVLYIYI